MSKKLLLDIKNLTICFIKDNTEKRVVTDISFHINKNEILGIVGESGSGKSITSLAIMGLLPKGISKITDGTILFNNQNILNYSNQQLQDLRGRKIAMIFQEPMSALNPSMTCGNQVSEILKTHTALSKKDIKEAVISLFKKVKLPHPEETYRKYPHEISGGQKQRVMIAMAIACKPDLLIADEPTTALDVTVQKEILKLLKSIQKETGMSILFISHDLSVVSSFANRVAVMYKGKIVEQNKTEYIFKSPKNSYTEALIKARPLLTKRLKRLTTVRNILNNTIDNTEVSTAQRKEKHKILYKQKPILEIRNLEKTYYSNTELLSKTKSFKALKGINLKVFPGETLGLVGESGCGKSTLGNAILQLNPATKGSILYKNSPLELLSKKEIRILRKEIQIIFQDPFASLNPRLTVGEAILEPMHVHKIGLKKNRKNNVISLLKKVGLNEESFYKYPHEFSGGQRQRVGIARTISLQPKLIVCDESVSALDISVQAQVLNLLNSLKEDYNFTYIFISHDLSVVKYMSDRVAVMQHGKIEEYEEADMLYENPKSNYTKKLINAIP